MMLKNNKNIGKIKTTKKTKMILFFLLLSFLFWTLIKLSKEYIDVVPVYVAYNNLPKDKILQNDPPKTLHLTLKTFGFDLIKYHLFKRKITIDLNSIKKKEKNLYYQPTKEVLSSIKSQVQSGVEVLSIKPDTLFYNIGQGISKTVSISPNLKIEYQSGYNLLGQLSFEPKEVTISGPELHIDSILKVETQNKTLSDINADFEITIPLLKLSKKSKVTYSVDKIRVKGSVHKFTEAKFTIPINVENLPENYTITTFPDEVEIIFQVGISDYKKLVKSDFKISCDYKRSQKDGLTYLIPKIVLKPSYISEIKIIPNKIDYLIKE